MAENSKESEINVDSFDFANEQATNDAPMLVSYLVFRLQQAMGNPSLQSEVQWSFVLMGFFKLPTMTREYLG
ncbi:hypothetical protein, partial [Enterobacter cloacae complex sp. 4DZ1-17B1]|uniref:hypothetical protein n=1 Tax=Enterobacter cloacae complex sp. 4DZ1-17B1 TaxID=2511991 RepID=UPI001CA4F39F